MQPLLEALDRARARRNTTAWLIGGGFLCLAAVSIVVFERSRSTGCEVPTARLVAIWDDTVRAKVGEAFRPTLDRYAERWLAASVGACQANDSPAVRDKRAICLEHARTRLGAVTATLIAEPTIRSDRVESAIARLPDIDACADVERLAATVSPPTDAGLRDRLAKLDAQLDRAAALRLRDQHAEALATVTAAVAEARAIGHAPATARALTMLGDVHGDSDDQIAAEAAYRDAASAAADAHDDLLAAEAWSNVLFAAAERNENLDAIAQLDPVVDAAVRRAGDPPLLRFRYLMSSGALADRRDDFATAAARFDDAMKVAPTPRHRAQAERNAAIVVWRRDGAVKASEAVLAALKHTEAAVGLEHLETGEALYVTAQVLNAAGRAADAKPYAVRDLAIRTRINGPESLPVASAHEVLGNIESNLKDVRAARVHLDTALAIKERLHVPDASLAISLGALGALLQYSDQLAEAVPYYVRSIALLEKSVGKDAFEYLMMSSNLAGTYERLGRCTDARPIIAVIQPALAKQPAYYPELLTTIARCDRAADRPKAIAEYEESLALCVKHECDPGLAALIRWELGSTLTEAKRELPRALGLVREARTALAAIDPAEPTLKTIDAWLAEHTP